MSSEGNVTMKTVTYLEAMREAMDEELARDETVFLLGEDIGPQGGVFGSTRGLLEKYGPRRVRQTPISECAIIGAACGASLVGTRPVAEIMYFDFVAIGMDQIFSQVGKLRYMSNGQMTLPLVIRTQCGGGRGKGPQHSSSTEAWFVHSPGIKVAMPSTPGDVKGLLKTAIRDDAPVLFIENSFLYNTKGEVSEEECLIPFGQADVKREGTDVTIVATSAMVQLALVAAESLKELDISAEVIDPRTLVPLDMDTILRSVAKTNRAVIVHEAFTRCGVGAEIAARLMEEAYDDLDAPVARVGGLEVPMPFAQSLEEQVMPSVTKIVKQARAVCYR